MRGEDYRETDSGDSGEAAAAGPAQAGTSADGGGSAAEGTSADGGASAADRGSEGEVAASNPFAVVRARTLIPWMLLIYPGLVLVAFLTGHLMRADMEGQAFQFIGDYAALSIAMVTWVLWATRRGGVGIRRLIGSVFRRATTGFRRWGSCPSPWCSHSARPSSSSTSFRSSPRGTSSG